MSIKFIQSEIAKKIRLSKLSENIQKTLGWAERAKPNDRDPEISWFVNNYIILQ